MDRLPLPLTLPFSPDLLWRYPLGVPSSQQPSSPLFDVKTQLPGALGPEPRSWNREDVVTFLRWCEREFDLPPLDLDKFQMNGKALVLLNKSDIAERAPGAGDVIHNALQLLLRDSPYSRAATGAGPVPSSPLTHSYPFANNQAQGSQSGHLILSPPASARTPTSASWPAPASIFASADLHNLGHIIQQTNSVTLSPSPSVDSNSQAGSPSSHAEQQQHQLAAAQAAAQAHLSFYAQAMQAHQLAGANGSNSGSQSDSEESVQDSSPRRSPAPSSSSAMHANPPASPAALSKDLQTSGSGGETLDSASNGRLLWDFLQQLLNDPSQRYSAYIAWKNRETGVFKITDPAGLARLWGIQKNHPSMNYDKMSRALRYYYRVNILRKVQGERHCYQFLRNPVELKSIKNISLLRQQMAAAAASAPSIGSSSNNNAKLADSTDCSAERYSPSSSSTAAHNNNNSGSHLPDDCPETKERNFASYDCDMPTDLTMESCERRSNNNHYLATVKHEKVAS